MFRAVETITNNNKSKHQHLSITLDTVIKNLCTISSVTDQDEQIYICRTQEIFILEKQPWENQ
jgi:hypothetical protein